MTDDVQPVSKPITSTKDLRDFLLAEMTSTAKGERNAIVSKAVCNYAQQIYNTLNMEIKYAYARAKLGTTPVEPVSFVAAPATPAVTGE